MKQNNEKTNVMRILDQHKVNYQVHTYNDEIALSGVEVATLLNQDPNQVFKTLVTAGKSNQYYVFMIPANTELDLKKAARSVNEKNIVMIKSKELLPLTGYIHGGCSIIGMKKQFKTIVHETAKNYDTVIFSAGKIGYQIEININDVSKVIQFVFADVIND
ncbi:Cys-tRNA(Pro) deacylase [Anaerorhabdus sp.]|jgi:Cys-tRNA(Pro)/Cys-tRNA(Cys) deacylase|uniref:Cys-tRNA(Pro) deacylase n=1 Tax=Anaerorhabdus sp. TaxID=1872524 RepID=UPI002FCC2C89